MSFKSFAESLDADEPLGKIYTFKIQVASGDAVTGASLLEVDKTSSGAATPSLIVISQQSLGLISSLLYGVTFRAQGRGAAGAAYVRCRFSTQLGNGDDVTLQLNVTQR